ncbi:MAG: hypothetical protein M3066_19690 [Actinomycetota bacterium]|nr:hypothetical protein [Actinomycetota bacterium]
MAVVAATVALVGVAAAIALAGSGSTRHSTQVSQAPGAKSASVTVGAGGPTATVAAGQGASTPATVGGVAGTAQPLDLPAHPTAEDVQRVLAGITAQMLAPASTTASAQPLTKEQVEAQLREQLKQLGINF